MSRTAFIHVFFWWLHCLDFLDCFQLTMLLQAKPKFFDLKYVGICKLEDPLYLFIASDQETDDMRVSG